MLIRRMTIEDVEQAEKLEVECFTTPWKAQSFCESLSRDDTLFLVCETEEKTAEIAGYIGMYLSFEEADITNIAVSPCYRRCGIASGLLETAKEMVRESGAESIFLEVRVSNAPAIALYEKKGFINLGVRKNFYDYPKEDAYIMKCDIV